MNKKLICKIYIFLFYLNFFCLKIEFFFMISNLKLPDYKFAYEDYFLNKVQLFLQQKKISQISAIL